MEVTKFIRNFGIFVTGYLISEDDDFNNRNESKFEDDD
jgi:hypothetical protein